MHLFNPKNILNIITTTETLKKKYINSYLVDKNKIKVLHNGSSLNTFFKKYKSNNAIKKIGYFGSIYKSRGIDMIIKLSKIDKNNVYVIYGGNNLECENFKKKYPYKNLFFNSYIPYSKVKEKLKKIDICILPYSKKITVSGNVGDIHKFTSPLKIFDYMKCGKLIICSNIKVIREVLKNNENSILIDNYLSTNYWLREINKIKSNKKPR